MGLPLKIITTAGTLGAFGGVVAGGYFSLTNLETIKGKLEAEKFTVLTSSSTTDEWKAVLDKYKAEKTHTFTGKEDKDVDEAYLKKECEKALSNKSDHTNNYKLAKRWCVKEESIDGILARRGYTLLDNSNEKQNENIAWNSNLKELQKDTSKFKAFKDKVGTTKENENVANLKAACKELNTKDTKTTDNKFNENIELATKWCSVKKDGK